MGLCLPSHQPSLGLVAGYPPSRKHKHATLFLFTLDDMVQQLQDIALIRKQTQLCMGLFSAGSEALQNYRLQSVEASTNLLNGDSLRTLVTALLDEHARLSLWSSNIGVFAEVQFSLDFRIRDEPDLQQAFIGHLEAIEYQMNICKWMQIAIFHQEIQ